MDSIDRFVEDMSLPAFVHDRKTSSAVIRKLELIENALQHILRDFQENHPEIPWESMACMRDRLIHAYSGLEHQSLWEVITREIPDLKRTVEATVVGL